MAMPRVSPRLNCSRRGFIASVAALGLGTRMRTRPSSADEHHCVTLQAFPVPAGDHPHDVAPAADGARVWYTAQASGHLGLLEPASESVERIPLGERSSPHGVIVGPDGHAWVTDSGRDEIQRVDPDSKQVERFPIGVTGANLNTAAFGSDGALWFTGQNGFVGRLDTTTGQMTTTEAPRGRGPYGICATRTGDVWFVSLAASYLGRLEWVDNQIRVTMVDPPTEGAGTRRVWADSEGRLWIAEWNAGQVACYDSASKEWREWRLPGDAPRAYAVYVDDRDIVWLTDFGANALVRFDPKSETFSSYPFPHASSNVRQLLGRPGEIWGAESGADHLVVARTVCAGP